MSSFNFLLSVPFLPSFSFLLSSFTSIYDHRGSHFPPGATCDRNVLPPTYPRPIRKRLIRYSRTSTKKTPTHSLSHMLNLSDSSKAIEVNSCQRRVGEGEFRILITLVVRHGAEQPLGGCRDFPTQETRLKVVVVC
ncbi:hypothetical protein T439DRAFT_236097 [Meredithblackwellia eburnea MCA 4105]